jgi:hypothetical protein
MVTAFFKGSECPSTFAAFACRMTSDLLLAAEAGGMRIDRRDGENRFELCLLGAIVPA